MKPPLKSDEKAIRKLIQDWAAATRENRNDDVLSGHDSRAIIFDVLAPLQYRGTASYQRSWADWQPTFEVPCLFEIQELKVSVGGSVAFCHCLIRCGGKLPSSELVEDLVRATICLQKKSRKWKIVHQHISMPVTK
jgi:ketosteroid isomerase-like protein